MVHRYRTFFFVVWDGVITGASIIENPAGKKRYCASF